MQNEKEVPYTCQFKRGLGKNGLFVIAAKVERNGVEMEETLLTLRPEQAVALGGILVSEGKQHSQAA